MKIKPTKTKFEALIADKWVPINDLLAVKRIAEFCDNMDTAMERLNNGQIVVVNKIKYRRSM